MLIPHTRPITSASAKERTGVDPTRRRRKPVKPKNAAKKVQNLNWKKGIKPELAAKSSAPSSVTASVSSSTSAPNPPAIEEANTKPPPAINATTYNISNTACLVDDCRTLVRYRQRTEVRCTLEWS